MITNLECLGYKRSQLYQGDMLVKPATAGPGKVCQAARTDCSIKNMAVDTRVIDVYELPIIALKDLLDNPGEYPVLPVESGALLNMAAEH